MENLTRPHQLHKDHLTEDMTLAKIALRADPYAAVLGRHDLDFCCHGGRTLAQACAETIAIEIDWNHRPLPELVDFIVDTHHAFTRAAIARITPLLAKVTGKHARRHPELLRIAESFGELAADMGPHMVREERVLFPYIRALASPAGAPSPTFVTVRNPVGMMMQEHDRAGELLAEISAATGDCAPPADACASFRALYAALAELRLDLMKHVALENSILFPRAVALEDQQHALAAHSA
jgi:regulator of cell morphogenesis and NO signaling